MTFVPISALSAPALALCIVSILLVPLVGVGLSLVNTGLGRSRSAAHLMLTSLGVISVAALAYFVCGFAWEGFAGRPAHVFILAGKSWNWIAAEPWFLRGLQFDGSPASLAAWLQIFTVGLTALVPLGSGADRWRLRAALLSTALLAGLTYPLFAHWVWGGGWLAQLGANFDLGHGFVDVGGASSIQVTGGLTALTIAWILGPRRGKYSADGLPTAIPGHNTVLALFGCLLALLGWTGLNSAGAILFMGDDFGRVPLVAANTLLAAAAGGLAAGVITHVRFGKPDASLSANGWIGGLVAISAGCAFVKPAEAVLIGLIAGGVVTFAIEWFELKLAVDDPGGSISAHAVGGIWGVLSVGLFAHIPGYWLQPLSGSRHLPGNGDSGQFLAQIVGVATLLGVMLPLIYFLNWLLNRIYPQRVPVEGERQGMDLYELGAGAYPEFVTHADEFTQRRT